MKLRTLMIACVGCAVLVAGCSSGANKGEFVTSFVKGATSGSSPFTKKQATCIGDALFDELGDDAAKFEKDVEKSTDLPPTVAKAIAKVGPDCVKVSELMDQQLPDSIPTQAKDCILKAFDSDSKLETAFWKTVSSGGKDTSDLESLSAEVATKCMTSG